MRKINIIENINDEVSFRFSDKESFFVIQENLMRILEQLNTYKVDAENIKFDFANDEINKRTIGEVKTKQNNRKKKNFHKNCTEKKVSEKIKRPLC